MTSVAAEVADGLIVHGFTTERYLREVTWPLIDAGLSASGRDRDQFTVSYPGLLATGETEQDMAAASAAVRGQIAFYASTPAYRAVLDLHGWGDLHDELHRLSVRGDWAAMSDLIDDDVLRTFAVVAPPDEAGPEIQRRYGDLIDRYTIYTPYPLGERSVSACRRRPAQGGLMDFGTPESTARCAPRSPTSPPDSATTTTRARPRRASSPASCGARSASTATSASTSPKSTAAAARA